jgi:ribonuclease HII
MLLPYLNKKLLEAGCDEAGRGCLAGAVFAATVILPPDFACEALNDSKQLTEQQRDTLRPLIEKEALAWAVGSASPQKIDKITRRFIIAAENPSDVIRGLLSRALAI